MNDPFIQKFAQAYQEPICKPLAGGAEAVALSADTLSPHFWGPLAVAAGAVVAAHLWTCLIKTAKLVALPFAGIDFKRTEGGGHFILDVNPAPMFAGKIAGLRIADYLVRYPVDA